MQLPPHRRPSPHSCIRARCNHRCKSIAVNVYNRVGADTCRNVSLVQRCVNERRESTVQDTVRAQRRGGEKSNRNRVNIASRGERDLRWDTRGGAEHEFSVLPYTPNRYCVFFSFFSFFFRLSFLFSLTLLREFFLLLFFQCRHFFFFFSEPESKWLVHHLLKRNSN